MSPLFKQLSKLINQATKQDMAVQVCLNGRRTRLRRVETEGDLIRIQYGTTQSGQYSTVLVTAKKNPSVGHSCAALDQEGQLFIFDLAPHRRMDTITADQKTADDRKYIGRRFGYLTIVQTRGWKNRNRMALCACKCGGQKIVRISSLLQGWVVSCGCRRGKNTELPLVTGAKYGHLTILNQVARPSGQTKKEGYYLVRCVCGSEHVRGRENIVTPKVPNCGCGGISSLIGTRFNRLVIIGEGVRERKQRYVLTRCDCGTQSLARLGDLKIGKKKSCGCLTGHKRQKAIEDPLESCIGYAKLLNS